MLAVQADGAEVETVEGLGAPTAPFAVAAGFFRQSRPAMRLLHAGHADDPRSALCARTHSRPRQDIRIAISGNICRCTGYQGIVEAALAAADAGRAGAST